MICRMSEKLQEARFFAAEFDRSMRRLAQEARTPTYHLHAFLAAACSVILIAEGDLTIWPDPPGRQPNRAPFRDWNTAWLDAHAAAKPGLAFLRDQRNSSAHEGAIDEVVIEWVPVSAGQYYTDRLPARGDWSWYTAANLMPSGDSEATIAEPIGTITVGGKPMLVEAFCSSCLTALEKLIVDFKNGNPKREHSALEHNGCQLTVRTWAPQANVWNADVVLTNVAKTTSRLIGTKRTYRSEEAASSAARELGITVIDGNAEGFRGRNVLP